MSAISDLISRQSVANSRTETALTRIEAGVKALQESQVPPADVTALEVEVARNESASVRAEAVAESVNPTP